MSETTSETGGGHETAGSGGLEDPSAVESAAADLPFSPDGLRQRFGADAESVVEFRGEITMNVSTDKIVDVCRILRDDENYRFNLCVDVSAVDLLPREPRFEVNYHLLSVPDGRRLRVKVKLAGPDPVVESVTGIWSGANWHEREVYDLMGVVFTNHPDLRRIQLTDDWVGHPHRKDYPVGKNPIPFNAPPSE